MNPNPAFTPTRIAYGLLALAVALAGILGIFLPTCLQPAIAPPFEPPAAPTDALPDYNYALEIPITAVDPQPVPERMTVNILPDGTGALNDAQVIAVGDTPKWKTIDDPVGAPDEHTTIIYSTQSTLQYESFTLGPSGLTSEEIESVVVYFRIIWTVGQPGTAVQPGLRLDGVNELGTEQACPVSYTTYSEEIDRPGGGTWIASDLADLELVLGLKGASGVGICTQAYVVVTYTGEGATPSVPAEYIVNIDVYRGSPTVETGNWTVNGRISNARIPWNVVAFDAIPGNYTIFLFVDTEALVDGSFLGTGNGNASTLEFDDGTPGDGFPYWLQDNQGTIINYNSTLTRFFINISEDTTRAANTAHTFYIYIPADTTSVSSNFSGDNTFPYFETFDTPVADLAAFKVAYTTWSSTNSPVVSVADSVLTLTGEVGGGTDLIYEDTYSIQEFQAYFRLASTVGAFGRVEMAAVDGAPSHTLYNQTIAGEEFVDSVLGAYEWSYYTAPFTFSDRHHSLWTIGTMLQMEDANNVYPDALSSTLANKLNTTTSAEAFRPRISVAGGSVFSIEVDWIAITKMLETPPQIDMSDITYPRPGAIFLNDNMVYWNTRGDLAFSDESLNQFFWWEDARAQLTRQPGDSLQASVRVELDLSSNQNIYAWTGNAAQSTPDAFNSASGVYSGDDYVDQFDNVTGDWTVKAGTFAVANVTEAVLDKGEVGNVGGKAGRVWSRTAAIIENGNGTGDYRIFLQSPRWEVGDASWPTPYSKQWATAVDGLGADWLSSGYPFRLAPLNTYLNAALQEGNDTYVLYSATITEPGSGFELFYNLSDIDNESAWAWNSNGPFLTTAWLQSKIGGVESDYILSYAISLYNSIWYVFINGISGGEGSGKTYLASATDAPEDWDSSSFTFETELVTSPGGHMEDGDFAYDGADWWIYESRSTGKEIWAWKTTIDNPADWNNASFVSQGAVTFTGLPPFATDTQGSPRLFYDGSDWWMTAYGLAVAEAGYVTQWVPNWNFIGKSATLSTTWVAQNPESKYDQTATAGSGYTSTINTPSFAGNNFEITAEVQLDATAGSEAIGVVFKYANSTDTGYVAHFDYNNKAPFIRLSKFVGGSYTTLDTLSFTFWPTPQFTSGYPARIRVQAYGERYKVSYSLWGNPWVEAINVLDDTYSGTEMGVWVISHGGSFDDFRVRTYLETDAMVGQGQEFDFSGGIRPNIFIGPDGGF